MNKLPYYVIPKWDSKDKSVVLFFPDAEANLGCILSYIRVGEHGEADMGYFRQCKPVPTTQDAMEQEKILLGIIRARLDETEYLAIRRRDTAKFQRIRWHLWQTKREG